MNRIDLAGTLVQDPQLKYTPNGLAILELPLAGTDTIPTSDGGRTLPWYHRATCFGSQAEKLAEHLTVGDAVFIPGRLNYRSWETDDGQKRSSLDVVADGFIEYLGNGLPTSDDRKGQPRLSDATNRAVLKGNLTRDAELRYTTNGHAVTRFGMAVNERFESKGEQQERTHFIDVDAWRDLAEATGSLPKGQAVIVEGRLVVDSWEGKDGGKRYATKIEATQVRTVLKVGERQAKAAPDIDEEYPDESSLPF